MSLPPISNNYQVKLSMELGLALGPFLWGACTSQLIEFQIEIARCFEIFEIPVLISAISQINGQIPIPSDLPI